MLIPCQRQFALYSFGQFIIRPRKKFLMQFYSDWFVIYLFHVLWILIYIIRIISSFHFLQARENIFTESNGLIKSIQVFLHALNKLRLCHVMEKTRSSSLPKPKSSKVEAFLKLFLFYHRLFPGVIYVIQYMFTIFAWKYLLDWVTYIFALTLDLLQAFIVLVISS